MATEPHTIQIMDLRRLTIRQQNAIDMLIAGGSDREVAEAVGVDRSTITRWRLYHPAFQAELNVQREATWGATKERIRSLIPDAVEAIAFAIRDTDNPDRAKLSLDFLRSVKVTEDLWNLDRRIDADSFILQGARANTLTMSDLKGLNIKRHVLRIYANLNGLPLEELETMIDQALERGAAEAEARQELEEDGEQSSLQAVNQDQRVSDDL